MRGDVTQHTREVFLDVPTQVLGEPAHLRCQLHITLDFDRGRFAGQHGLQHDERRVGGNGDQQVGFRARRRAVQQTGRRHQQINSKQAPANVNHTAFFSGKAILRFLFLHQDVVQEKDYPLLTFFNHPCRRIKAACEGLQKWKWKRVAHALILTDK